MLAPGIPLGPQESEICFDPDRWLASCQRERTAYRGLAASSLVACCDLRLGTIEKLPAAAWDEKRHTLLASIAGGQPQHIPLLDLAEWALGLMRATSGAPDATMLFVTAGGVNMPPGNLRDQLIAFGHRNGIAEHLPSSLSATFGEAFRDGPMADAVPSIERGAIGTEELRRQMEAYHPLAGFCIKRPAPLRNENERLVARALACTRRRNLDKEQREKVRLDEFPVLFEAWKARKLSAVQFAMHLGLDNVHRWIKRYRRDGMEGLRHAPTPDRYREQILAMRIARGDKESVAAFHAYLHEQGIHVSEPWLAKTLEHSPVPNSRVVWRKWRRDVLRIFAANEPVKNASAFWRLLRDEHGYPYDVYTARNTISDAGLEFASQRASKVRSKMAKRDKVARLYRQHSPVRRIDEFLVLIRREHGVSMTSNKLRDLLEEAGVRKPSRHVSAEATQNILTLYGKLAPGGVGLKDFWRILRDEHGFTQTLTCIRTMLIRHGRHVPRAMTEPERRRWT